MPRADWCQGRAAPSGESEAACPLAHGHLVMASSLNRPPHASMSRRCYDVLGASPSLTGLILESS